LGDHVGSAAAALVGGRKGGYRVQETYAPGMSVSLVARRHGMRPISCSADDGLSAVCQ